MVLVTAHKWRGELMHSCALALLTDQGGGSGMTGTDQGGYQMAAEEETWAIDNQTGKVFKLAKEY